jgi:hypothetical protein
MADGDGATGRERCSSCGAAVYEGAEWCGLCFASLKPGGSEGRGAGRDQRSDQRSGHRPSPPTDPVAEGGTTAAQEPAQSSVTALGVPEAEASATEAPAIEAPAAEAVWPCSVCGARNPIELDACATCGTSLRSLFDEQRDRPRIEPASAFRWSLLYPGLGHAKAGSGLDGFARGVLFTMLVLMAGLVLATGATSGPLFGILTLFGGTAVAVYFFSAAEAYRLAEGGSPFVPAKFLLWGAVVIIVLSVMLLAFVLASASNR